MIVTKFDEDHTYMLTKKQLAEREGRIFSTDAAAAIGVSNYRTPYQLWAEKIGLVTHDEEDKPWQIIGSAVEPAIATLYTQRTGRGVDLFKVTLTHDAHPWMGSHFDYISKTNDRLVEIKFFDPRRRAEFGDPGSADIPNDVLVQTIHEMVVSSIPLCDVAVLFGNQAFEVFSVALEQKDADELIEREYQFMRYIIEREPPPPMSDDDLKAMFPRSVEETITATEEIMQAVRESRMIGERMGGLAAAYEATNLAIKGFMGSNAKLVSPDGSVLATWRSAKDLAVIDWEKVAHGLLERAARDQQELVGLSGVLDELITTYTSNKPGSRRFLMKEEK